MNESDLNRLLQQALAPKEFPSDQLNQTIRNRVQEEQTMKRFSKKRPLAAALVAALVLALSITGFASWRFLSAGEAAEHSGMSNLARALKAGMRSPSIKPSLPAAIPFRSWASPREKT